MANFGSSKLKKKRAKRKRKRISHLPDELWRKILDLGIKNSKFTYKDLCCISITCKRLHQLSDEDSLWNPLLSSDFPYIFSLLPSIYRRSSYWDTPWFDNSLSNLGQLIVNDSSSSSSSSSAKSCYKIRIIRMRVIEKEEERMWFPLFPFRSIEFKWPIIFDELGEIKKKRRAEMKTVAAVLSKIQEIELTEQEKKRKPIVAEYFNLLKVICNGYECVPDRRYPREKRSKFSTWQRKCWYQ